MTRSLFDAGMSVNDTISRFPESLGVFNSLGVDACCGGANSLAEAARDAGVRLDDLILALDAARSKDGAAA